MKTKLKAEPKYILYRQWDSCRAFYVTEVPGDGGKDWGYTEQSSKAVPVSRYWMARFKADCARVGSTGNCFEA